MAAKYLVVEGPGTPVPGVGFVVPNSAFTAPAGYVPSRTFKPMNEEASQELAKVKAAMLKRADEFGSRKAPEFDEVDQRSGIQYARELRRLANAIDLGVFVPEKEEPKVETNVVENLDGLTTPKKSQPASSRKL